MLNDKAGEEGKMNNGSVATGQRHIETDQHLIAHANRPLGSCETLFVSLNMNNSVAYKMQNELNTKVPSIRMILLYAKFNYMLPV